MELSSQGMSAHTLGMSFADLLVPLLLDFILFTVVADRILRGLEERRWRTSRILVLTKLVRVADRLMIDLTPPGIRQLSRRTIRVNGVEVEALFAWSTPGASASLDTSLGRDLTIRLPRIRSAIARARDAISVLPQGLGGHSQTVI